MIVVQAPSLIRSPWASGTEVFGAIGSVASPTVVPLVDPTSTSSQPTVGTGQQQGVLRGRAGIQRRTRQVDLRLGAARAAAASDRQPWAGQHEASLEAVPRELESRRVRAAPPVDILEPGPVGLHECGLPPAGQGDVGVQTA